MHYYKFDISAWALHTAHLTPEEEAVYFRLINFYYDTETPIPQDTTQVLRRLRMVSYGTQAAAILAEFFTLTEDGWRHNRCDKVIMDYHLKVDRNREYGKLGGRPRMENPTETQTVSEPNQDITLTTNYKLLTTNHKLKTKNHTPKERQKGTDVPPPDGVSDALWADFKILRKSKKMPITMTALQGIARESAKARISVAQAIQVCCERGWGGFKADWMTNAAQPAVRPAPNLAAARAIFGDERNLSQHDFVVEVEDVQPKIAR